MTRKERAAMARAVQHLVNAEVAYSWRGTLTAIEQEELLTHLQKARRRVKRLQDKHTDPVVLTTKERK